MIYYKTEEEIALMRESGQLVSRALEFVAETIREGMTGKELDALTDDFIMQHNAWPSFKGFNDFPNALCISINEQIVHGIPSSRPFEVGDIVSVDCGVTLNGFVGDSAYTFVIGETKPELVKLLQVTNNSLYLGIGQAIAGNRIGDISYAIQDYVERQNKFWVPRELTGHGVGRDLHEEPVVSNNGKRGKGTKMLSGLVIAIEPMVNIGTKTIKQLNDNWTLVTGDRKPSAHFEHTVVVRPKKAEILTDHSLVEIAVKKNSSLMFVTEKSATFAP